MLLNTYEPWKFAFSATTDFENIKKDSYGIIGVPFDSTSSYHSGSRLGPIVVREASYGFERYNVNFKSNLDTTFYDFGDVNVVPGNCEATCKIVEDTANELIDLDVKPITIGGEHSASIGVIKALSEKYSHATVMRRAHEFGVDLVQIGIRSSSADEEEFVKSTYNIQTFKTRDVHRHMDAVEYYLTTVDTPVYLSVDMDVLSPAIAPAVGNPTSGGLFTYEIEDVIKSLSFKEVVGLDVVETATNKLGENTAVSAAKIIYDFLSLI